MFNNEIEKVLKILKSINPRLADTYKELIDIICDIVIENNGTISNSERELANKIKALKV